LSETAAIAGCLAVLLAAGLVERLLRDRARAAVPIRVHVNGTRGKSTVTRLIAAALRAHGIPTLARVTGTEARVLLPDGTERPVRRLGPANIREELRFLLLARRLGARAAVVECMAIRPDLQYAAEREMVGATIGVVTNVRTDHTEVMGASLAEIAASLASTVPRGGVLVLGTSDFAALFRERAAPLGTRVIVVGPPGGTEVPWLEEDLATALEVTRLLGVPEDVARAAMESAAADPGAFRERVVSLAGRPVPLLDARAANDPESFALLCRTSTLLSSVTGPVLAVYNHRHDRPDRLRRFVPSFAALPGARVLLTGDRPALGLTRAARRATGQAFPFVPVGRLRAAVEESGAGAVVLCGNSRGLPADAVVGGSPRG
jgi:poly-gamma-glutamate synthase PgsB/CapB